jgi:peroxiredoxin
MLAILTVGSPARLFTLPAVNEDVAKNLINHDSISLGDFIQPGARVPSSAIVLFFFDRGAGGADLVTLNRMARRNAKAKVQFLAISADQGEPKAFAEWVALQGLTFPVLLDTHGIVTARYEIEKLPLTIIVDPNGRMVSIGNPTGTTLESELDAGLSMLVDRKR